LRSQSHASLLLLQLLDHLPFDLLLLYAFKGSPTKGARILNGGPLRNTVHAEVVAARKLTSDVLHDTETDLAEVRLLLILHLLLQLLPILQCDLRDLTNLPLASKLLVLLSHGPRNLITLDRALPFFRFHWGLVLLL